MLLALHRAVMNVSGILPTIPITHMQQERLNAHRYSISGTELTAPMRRDKEGFVCSLEPNEG